jgi:DNA-binding CsgD family transcriptional regulator
MLDSELPRSGILDRVRECDVLDRLVAEVRAGKSHVLVLRGEAGIGKTALLDHLSAAAAGSRIVRVAGVESEMELGFAGLHALCAPMLSRLEHLPAPQREALGTAFGLSEGDAPDRFLVGLAVLSMLADAAEEKALFCIVDDAQWLDQVSLGTLVFVARRLLAERVGIVFALRGTDAEHELKGFPELMIGGLPEADALALLEASIPGPLDKRVQNRILGEAAGNPLALLELPRGTKSTAAAGFGLPDELPLTGRIEHRFVGQVGSLPGDTQRLLVLAAAEPLGDVPLLWRAAELLGIARPAAGPAEAAGLVEIGARVQFRHPLVRSAAYVGASAHQRREVHRALAEATDPQLDPDRRAWHRARAADGPDEGVAGELEGSAGRAQARGGMAAAAAFLARAAELTPDPATRVERSLAAAEAKLDVADASAASDLLAAAELGPLDGLQRARLERVSAQIVFVHQRGGDAPRLLLAAAHRLAPLNPEMARETFLESIASAMFAGRLGRGADGREIAEAARTAFPSDPTTRTGQLLNALVTRFTEGYAASVEPLLLALRPFSETNGRSADRRWLGLACRLAQDLWDDELWQVLATRGVQEARDTGALELLPNALNYLAGFNVHTGEFASAAAQIEEVDAITVTTGVPPLKYGAGMLAAARGDEAYLRALHTEGVMQGARERGEGSALGGHAWFTAWLQNGYGRYAEAFESAKVACEHEDPNSYGRALAELVESGVRCGRPEEASAAFERLCKRTEATGTEWALGIEARCRGLLGDEEAFYEESAERLARCRGAFELARSQLVFGEWLRRQNRRVDARERLRAAHEMFSRMGAEAFADRAGRELSATGETVRKRTVETRDDLTSQEAQVARLAREGETNSEIGAQLFISPRTVEYHLHKVFAKLGISSRKDLRRALPAAEDASSLA